MQEIKYIDIDDLVLWSENPRDPFGKKADNQTIANRAISHDGRSRWSLKKLFKDMGNWYDNSEIPTVIYDENRPIVFDGNRRVLIGKIIHGCVEVSPDYDFSKFDFPKSIPCNVCDKETALRNVTRKHAKGGSWKPLERDIFRYEYLKKEKSIFLILEELTGIISSYPFMNRDFVKEELLSKNTLENLDIFIKNGVLETSHSDKEFEEIFWEIVDLVKESEITTRKNRGQLISLLEKDSSIKSIISKNKGKKAAPYTGAKFGYLTPRTKTRDTRPLFGKELSLKSGIVNNLYRDLRDMYAELNRDRYSHDFIMIIRMGLRLLCEVAETDLTPKSSTKKNPTKNNKLVELYIKRHFIDAKKERTQKEREFFNTNSLSNFEETDMIGLLQKSGHPGSDTISKEQTVALSIIVGKILEKTHGKSKQK